MAVGCVTLDHNGFDTGLIGTLQTLVHTPIREDVPGVSLTTFAIGGPVRALVTVETCQELSAVVSLLVREGQSYRVIGNGSNVLISDEGLKVWLIKLGTGFRKTEVLSRGEIEVFGGVSLMSFSRRVSDDGLSGLEFAAGIPASIGGAVCMNAGAHGAEICSRIRSVNGVLGDGSPVEWGRDELEWGYRRSGLPSGAVVTSIRLHLVDGDRKRISELCSHNLSERRARQPLTLPSAGSVFKNPSPELPAGRLLEELGMKGYAIGGASISELHANWIVNAYRNGTARDVVSVIEACKARALSERGIVLEPEVRVWF